MKELRKYRRRENVAPSLHRERLHKIERGQLNQVRARAPGEIPHTVFLLHRKPPTSGPSGPTSSRSAGFQFPSKGAGVQGTANATGSRGLTFSQLRAARKRQKG